MSNTKKYKRSDVEAARVNMKERRECSQEVKELFEDCPDEKTSCLLSGVWNKGGWVGNDHSCTYRIPQNWPPEDKIIDDDIAPTKPKKAERVHCGFDIGGVHYDKNGADGADHDALQAFVDEYIEHRNKIKVNVATLRKKQRLLAKLTAETNGWK